MTIIYRYNLKITIQNMEEILYADFELNSDNMFVITPEGNKFTFNSPEYNEKHDAIQILDPASHKQYTVVFNE